MSFQRSVVHLSTQDNLGGSGRSAYRIHDGLRRLGWKSRMLVGNMVTHDADVETVYGGNRASKWAGYFIDRATRQVGLANQWLPWSSRLRNHPWVRDADVIQLYNLHGGYFPIPLLPHLSRHAPLVWRLSDMWPMTGLCVYAGTCEKWKSGCGACPVIRDYVSTGIDTSALLWKQKRRLYSECDITIVAPSSWTERLARESPLLGCFPVHRIPNGLDTNMFRPLPREMACEVMRYDPSIRRILFVAQSLDNDPRKGGDLLMDAIKHLGHRPRVDIVLAGVGGLIWSQANLPIPVRRAGYIADDRLMAALYSSCDVIVVPSSMENLPNTLLEAMACGLPAVALDAGGMGDAVIDGVTGFLIEQGDIPGLSTRVGQLLDDCDLRAGMGREARRLIEREFSSITQAERFSTLYDDVVALRESRPRKVGAFSG